MDAKQFPKTHFIDDLLTEADWISHWGGSDEDVDTELLSVYGCTREELVETSGIAASLHHL